MQQHAANAFRPLYAAPPNPPNAYATGPGGLVSPPLQPLSVKRQASQTPLTDESPAKKTTKWTQEEDELTVELRGAGMKWEDISKRIPGRSAISCRLRYQNYLEKRAHWDEEKKNKLARLYVRFKEQMWQKVASEMGVPWRSAEAMHWTLGPEEIASRANQPVFQLSAAATANPSPATSHPPPHPPTLGSAFTPTNATTSPTYTSQGPPLAPLAAALSPQAGHASKRSRSERDAANRRRADSARSGMSSSLTGTSPGTPLHRPSASEGGSARPRPTSGEYVSPFAKADDSKTGFDRRGSVHSSLRGSRSPHGSLPPGSANVSGDEAASHTSDRRSVRSLSGSTARDSGRERDDNKDD